jgi:glycosyltransferase involved in cell wall biosynthesis
MDIFCLSSRFEGFPNVVAEAMAMGLPCVVTDAGDAGFLIGEFGTVVPVAEPAELAAGIAEFVRRGQKHRQHIGGAARERVRAEFSIEKMRARFQGVYSRLTSSI